LEDGIDSTVAMAKSVPRQGQLPIGARKDKESGDFKKFG
jgi:hypothetical protein